MGRMYTAAVEAVLTAALDATVDSPIEAIAEAALAAAVDAAVRIASGLDASKRGTARAMRESEFCLVPRGDTPSSGRLFAALQCGCVPLVLSTQLPQHLPFRADVNYSAFLGQISEHDFMMCDARRAVEEAIAALTPQLPEMRAAMRVAAPDLLFDVPGSRVAERMVQHWSQQCALD